MSKSRVNGASQPAKAAPTAPPINTRAVAEVHERVLTKSAAPGRESDTSPGQQIAREMARRWLAQGDIDAAGRPAVTSAEQTEITQLKAEINRLREDNEILKAAMVLLAGDLDPRNPGLISG